MERVYAAGRWGWKGASAFGLLRKNFPAAITSDTVKKLGVAPNNESYVINALQLIGVIDEEGDARIGGMRSSQRTKTKNFRMRSEV
jgi:hypothetical protein